MQKITIVPSSSLRTAAPALYALTARFLDALNEEIFPFDALLAEIVRYQWAHNAPLQHYWRERNFDPSKPFAADAVPAVPTDVFRFLPLVTNEAPAQRVFRTSGTTSGARGEHHHVDTTAYDAGALRQFQERELSAPQRTHFIHIAFDAETTPDSSLSHMLALFGEHLGSDARSQEFYFDAAQGLRVSALRARLQSAVEEGEPVILFGTAFGLADTLDHIAPLHLPAGSRIIQTGGFKGRREALDATEFYALLADHYGIAVGDVLAEYGMTELSSQLYSLRSTPTQDAAAAAKRRLVPPPWCQVRAVNPQTLDVLPDGEIGLLRFVDLANLDSVVAVQTSDLGIIHPDGVELIGRSPESTPRGCSLAIEEIRRVSAHS